MTTASAAVLLVGAPAAAQAQTAEGDEPTALSEIIVTAQKRSERLQDVPLAVNVATADQLAAAGVSNVEGLAAVVPGLNLSKSFGAFQPAIRGISTISNTSENPTALYVDGVLIADQREGFRDLADVEQVTVLKGPQGTLFGRNATAGVIQITTRRPSFTPEGSVSVGYDNYETLRTSGYATGGVTDDIAVSASFAYAKQSQGYGKSLVNGMATYQLVRDMTVRGKLLYAPNDETSITLIGDFQDKADSGQAYQPFPGTTYSTRGTAGVAAAVIPFCAVRNQFDSCSTTPGYNTFKGGGVSAEIDREFSFARFVSITAYRRGTGTFKFDVLEVPQPLLIATAELPGQSFTQEFQLISPSGGRLQWVAGVFYIKSRLGYSFFTTDFSGVLAPLPTSPSQVYTNGIQRTESVAPFAQLDYKLTDTTTLTVGGRFTYEKRSLTGFMNTTRNNGTQVFVPATPGSMSIEEPTWRIALTQELGPDIRAFASYNRGIKSGGFSVAAPTGPSFEPETLDDWEVGLKSQLFDGRLTLNGTAFYYKYKNMQVASFINGAARATIGNVGRSTLYGLDVDFLANLTPDFDLAGGFEVMHAEYDRFPGATISTPASAESGGGIIQVVGDGSGARVPLAQKFAATLSGNYRAKLGEANAVFSLTANYNGDYNLDVDFAHQKSYVMLNGSVVLTDPSEKISLRLAVTNLLNEKIIQKVNTSAQGARTTYAAPRIFSVTAGYKF